jgi:hypothetical protein
MLIFRVVDTGCSPQNPKNLRKNNFPSNQKKKCPKSQKGPPKTGIGIKEENQQKKLFKLFGTVNDEHDVYNKHG